MIFFYWLILLMPLVWHPIWGRFVDEEVMVKCLGGICLIYSVIHLAAKRKIPSFFSTPQAAFFFILYLLAGISYFTKGQHSVWQGPFVTYTAVFLLFFVTLSLVDSLHRLRWVLLLAVGSMAFAALCVLREWQKYHDMDFGMRPGWAAGDANYFTLSALVCLPIALSWPLERRHQLQRIFCVGCLVLTLVGITLAASRGGFLGVIAALGFVAWHSRQRSRNLVLAGALLVPLVLAVPGSPLQRLLHPSYGDKEATERRTALWTAGLRMVWAHPVAGIGLGNFKTQVMEYGDPGITPQGVAHNSYLEIAAEMGVPGLLAFLAVLYFTLRTLEGVRRRALRFGPPLLHGAALGMQAGLVGYAVGAFFISGQYQKLFWLMVFLSMCLASLSATAAPKRQAAVRLGWNAPWRSSMERQTPGGLGCALRS